MPAHIMLSYQWDDQALVKRIYNRLKDDGLPAWMDVEGGGSTGNISDAMAAGVEEAVVVCPLMTPAYQASRSCKKELSYADSREVTIVPPMLANDREAQRVAGSDHCRSAVGGRQTLSTVSSFRNAEKDEEHFELCLSSLEEEIMFNAGHLLAAGEPSGEVVDQAEPSKPCLKKKPGRGFRHALSKLYICETGEQLTDPTGATTSRVELNETPGDHCYWEEIKGNGCKYYRNVVSNRYLGFDPSNNQVYSEASPSVSEEWLMLADPTDQSHQRAVIIKNKHSGMFLAAQNGHFIELTSYNEDCKWLLE